MRTPQPILLMAILVAIGFPLFSQGAQGAPNSPGLKFTHFGRNFFRTHRGKVLKHWFEKYRNSNSELDGEMHTELHQGFRFEFIRGDRYTSDEFAYLIISDPRIRLPLGIQLGDSKEKIQKVLGNADISTETSLEYELSYEMAFLNFHFRRGRLIEVEVSIDHE